MYKNVIVPIDLDKADKAQAILDKAKELTADGGKVTLLNVVADVPGLITAELPDGLIQEAAHKARDNLLDLVKDVGVAADVQVRSGSPHHAIVSLADELGADLILIASHSPGLRDYFLGATAANVVRHAKCSVLVHR
jgi:nucleotide-binding universal stress UspA family protein